MPDKEGTRAADKKELQKAAIKCKSLTGYFCEEHFLLFYTLFTLMLQFLEIATLFIITIRFF